MTKKADKLTTKQRRALAALLDGATKKGAAAAAGVTARTLSRWLHDDDAFNAALKRATRQAADSAAVRLSGLVSLSLDVLRQLLESDTTPSSVRLRAAQHTLDAYLRLLETTDILERLETLEHAVEAR